MVCLQKRIQELQRELHHLQESDARDQDPEAMVRSAASVTLKESEASKYLGPASGIAITRLVIQLAKQSTEGKSINEIVSDEKVKTIRQRFLDEEAKPTSKTYPLISHVAASGLPNPSLTALLVQLYLTKGRSLDSVLHEV